MKPGELLPSVLRTTADLSATNSKSAAAVPAAASSEHGRRPGAAGQHQQPTRSIAPAELLGTSSLPRVDAAAHHQALPARAALSTSPNRNRHTPERHRPDAAAPAVAGRGAAGGGALTLTREEQQPLRSSGDGPPGAMHPAAAAAAAAAAVTAAKPTGSHARHACAATTTSSSSSWKPPDSVPAVGTVAMTVLPSAWLSGTSHSTPAASAAAAASSSTTSAAADSSSQQPTQQLAADSSVAMGTLADDLRLLRPVDPTNPSHYWKPLPGSGGGGGGADGKGRVPGAGNTIDSILGAQLLLDAGSSNPPAAPVGHTRQRKSILLRVPLGSELFLSAVPAVIQDRAGHACLLVLPSDKPSNRREAVAVEELLAALLEDPSSAVRTSCEWRASTLGALCAESLGVVAEALKQRGPPGGNACWQFRQLTRNLTGKVLGSGMAEAVGALVSSSHPNPAAAQLATLINSKDAAEHVAAAANEATLHAAAATAPAATKPLRPLAGGMSAAEAAASLSGTATDKHPGLQQQLSKAAARLQSPQGGSRSSSLSPTVRSQQQQQRQLDATVGSSSSSSGAAAAQGPDASSPSRRNTGTYASLTVLTGADRPPSGSGGSMTAASTSASSGTSAAAAAATSTSPGSRQGSAAGGARSPSLRNPALSPGRGSSMLQHNNGGSNSRCSSPAAVNTSMAPGTPQGSHQATGGGCALPAAVTAAAATPTRASSSSRDVSPGHAARSSSSTSTSVASASGQQQQRQEHHRRDSRCHSPAAGAPAAAAALEGDAAASKLLAVGGGGGMLLHLSSRLSSASGQSSPAAAQAHSNQQLPALEFLENQDGQQDWQQQQQQMLSVAGDDAEGAALASSSSGAADSAGSGGQLSSLYGLSLSAAICMADLVRQVEVACVERGHALAYAWNCSISAAEASMVALRAQNHNLLALNSQMAAGQEELAKELKAVDFLRREALRFRRAMEEAQEKLGAATEDNARLREQLEDASSELAAVEAFANKRLARLRWRNAFAVLGTWTQHSVIQSGAAKADKGRVLPKVKMLERLANAVSSVEHRKATYGRMAHGAALLGEVAHSVAAAGPHAAPAGRMHLGNNYGGSAGPSSDAASAQMLSVLTAEARTMVLAGMPPAQRWRLMEAMKDEERAEIVVAMGLDLRKEAAAALEPRVWERTLDIVKNSGTYAARYLKAWDTEDAAKEFMAWGTFQQVDCLTSLDAYTAAAVLTRAPDAVRKDLLGMLEPYVAANIVQSMLPPPAAAAMEALDMKKAMAILIAMDPNKAADVLTEMGAPQAANKLILMEADARNSIIESMAPRAAANTLTKMEDAMQAAAESGEFEPGSPEMLTLSGGAPGSSQGGSPVMGAFSDLDPSNAYTIMSYMSIKDKAALLASMEPDAVARLLGCMDPNEAVLLLSALGDGSGKLVGNCLSSEDRDRLVEVLQAADCQPGSFSGRARVRGSLRAAAEVNTVDRLVGAYQAIEAVALEGDEEQEGGAAADSNAKGGTGAARRNKRTASFNERQKQGRGRGSQQHQQQGRAPAKSIGVQVGGGLDSGGLSSSTTTAVAAGYDAQHAASTSAGGAAEGSKARAAAAVRARTRTISSTGGYEAELGETDAVAGAAAGDAGGFASAHASTAASAGGEAGKGSNSNKGHAAGAAGKKGVVASSGATATGAKKTPNVVSTAHERRLSSSSTVDCETSGSAAADAGAAHDAAAATKKATGAGAAAASGGGSSKGATTSTTAAGKIRRTRASDADMGGSSSTGLSGGAAGAGAAAGGRRASVAADERVPALQLGGGRSSSSSEDVGEDTTRAQHAGAEHSTLSSDLDTGPSGHSTPRTAAATTAASRGGASRPAPQAAAGDRGGSNNAAAAAKSAAAGRRALKEALKSQAAAKRGGMTRGAGAAGAGSGAGQVAISREGRVTGDEEAAEPTAGSSPAGGVERPNGPTAAQMDPPPQVKLGRVPKNARLIEAMAQHKNAKPKPKGWLMAVVDSIYKEGETLLRKLGRADMVKKQSVPEIVFAYFHNKYGQRALVNENVGSLVNTLTLYQHTDLRLEAFARQLSEEWDVSIFLDFLIAQNLCLQPAKVVCIEYPREAGKDEQYPWVCLWKAAWVADNVLGVRAAAARERFNEFLHMASLPADDLDVERLRRERREAAAKDGLKGSDADLPDKFFKLPRIRFLLLLCKELLRINRYIISFGEDRFTAMDVQRSGSINIVAVRGFVKSMSPGSNDAQVSGDISTFVANAEAAVRDIPPEQVSVPSVTELSREAFVAGVNATLSVRDHIKLHLLPPARLEEENEEAQIFFSLLGVLMARHSKALLPTWEGVLASAGQRAANNTLQQQLAAVAASGTATDARFKAYVGLLLGLINVTVQGYVDGLLSSESKVDTLESDQLEQGLLRLEDVALILVCGSSYLLADESPELAMARTMRLPLGAQIATMGAQLLTHRRLQDSVMMNAAAVLQRVWRARQRQRRLEALEQ